MTIDDKKHSLRGEHLAGIVVTISLHAALVAFLVSTRAGGNKAPAPAPEVIDAELLTMPIKAGAPYGTFADPSKVQSGVPWGKRLTGPVRHPYGPRPTRPSARHAAHQPRPTGPGYVRDRFAPAAKHEDEELRRKAELERMAEQEMANDTPQPDPSDIKYGRYGTAEKGRTDVTAKGAYGTSNTGLDDPCVLGFAKAVSAYRGVIQKKISGFRRPSFISPALAENLVAGVRVTFNASGSIVAVRTVSSSGNDRFDHAAEMFIRKIRSFGPAPRCVMFDKKIGVFKKTRSFKVNMKGR